MRILFVVVGILALLEAGVAAAYLTKRRMADQPFVDLLENLYVLRPFRGYFPDQYTFPSELRPLLKGETTSPATLRRNVLADPLLGHRLAPNSLVVEETWTWYATNAQGFTITDPEAPLAVYAVPKPTGTVRIVMLGGSTVHGDGASGSLHALPAELLRTLREGYLPARDNQTRFEVINAGVGGYTSQQELLYYLSELRLFEPDLVIAYDGWNDFQRVTSLLSGGGARYPWLRNESTDRQRSILNSYYTWSGTAVAFAQRTVSRTRELLDGVALVHVLRRAISAATAPTAAAAADLRPVTDELLPLIPEAVRRYEANTSILAGAVTSSGASFAWFLQPLVGVGNKIPAEIGRERSILQSRPNDIARRQIFYSLARAAQSTFKNQAGDAKTCAADLSDVFDGNDAPVFEDSGHLYDPGNVIVANRIAQELERCGFVAQRP